MKLSVHVERVVVHGEAELTREALEVAIADALRAQLGTHEAQPTPTVASQVGLAVAPTVLGRLPR